MATLPLWEQARGTRAREMSSPPAQQQQHRITTLLQLPRLCKCILPSQVHPLIDGFGTQFLASDSFRNQSGACAPDFQSLRPESNISATSFRIRLNDASTCRRGVWAEREEGAIGAASTRGAGKALRPQFPPLA